MHSQCPYHQYYINQAGSGVGVVYKGARFQRGHGIGSFLKGMFRTILPLIKNGVKTIGKEALKGSASFLSDISENKPIKESFKIRLNETGNNLKTKAENKIQRMVGAGGGIKRKLVKNKNHNKKETRKRNKHKKVKHCDIFS